MLGIGTKKGTKMKELGGIRSKNERTGNVIRKTWNDDQHMKVQKRKHT